MIVLLNHFHVSLMTSGFPVCMTLFVSLQTSGPQGSLKEDAKSSLQKSFRVFNDAMVLENDVKGMFNMWDPGSLNARKIL